jgi:hypothetical protein
MSEKFDLVNDEDSCCGLMHIVDNEENFICRGNDERRMISMVNKLNLHDELVGALRKLMATEFAEDCQECAIGQTDEWEVSRKLLAKIDADEAS